ncbi:hypothetical protein IW262DRAFT_1417991, partial [Armillaria fumosa]
AGSRVFFFSSIGHIIRGVVESTSQMANGTELLVIRCDNGRIITLPSLGVSEG